MIPPIRPLQQKEPHLKPLDEVRHLFNGSYHVLKIAGEGAYAKVYEAVDAKSNKKFAIKEFINALTTPKLAQCCLREIEIVAQGKHSNVVKLYGLAKSERSVYMVMDYMPTDLRTLIRSPTYFDHAQVKKIMYEILLALNYMHSSRIVHRDIKPGNILFSMDETPKITFQVKVCDFGLARSISGLKNCFDFDQIYRKEFALSNEQNGVIGGAEPNERPEDEDLDEHVTVGEARSIEGHFGVFQKAHMESDSSGPISLPKSKSYGRGPGQPSQADNAKEAGEETKLMLKPSVSVTVRRNQFFKDIKQDPTTERELTSHIASRWYRAPEVILLEKAYSTSIDMWSGGCVFAELLQMINGNRAGYKDRRPLFPGTSCFPLSPQIKQGTKGEIEYFHSGDQLITICRMLGTPPEDSLTFVTDIGARQYLQMFPRCDKKDVSEMFPECTEEELDLLQKMLSFDPFQRITAKEALRHSYFKTVRCKERETEEGVPIVISAALEGEAAIKKLAERCKKGI